MRQAISASTVSTVSVAAVRLAEKCDRPARPTATRAGPDAVSVTMISVNTGEAGQRSERGGPAAAPSTDSQTGLPSMRNRCPQRSSRQSKRTSSRPVVRQTGCRWGGGASELVGGGIGCEWFRTWCEPGTATDRFQRGRSPLPVSTLRFGCTRSEEVLWNHAVRSAGRSCLGWC